MPPYIPLNRLGRLRSVGIPPQEGDDTYPKTLDGLPGGPPKAHWRLGESVGPTMVERKAGRNGTYFGTPGFGAPSLPQNSNAAVDFQANGYAEVPHDAGLELSALTVLLWFKVNNLPTGDEDPSQPNRHVLFSKGQVGLPPTDGDFDVWVDVSGNITVQFQTSSDQIPIPAGAITANSIHSLVIRADNSGFDAALDGLYGDKDTTYTAAWINNDQALLLAAAPWHVSPGGIWPTDGFFADAVIDEVAIWDRALTDIETLTVAQYNSPPVAVNDSASVEPSTTKIVNVVGNDTFTGTKADLGVEITQQGSLGTATVRSDNDVDYVAGSTEGDDVFRYRITDGFGTSAPADVSMAVQTAPPPGEGGDDGQGGTLIYQWQPPLGWIEGVPLADRSFNNALNLDRFTDPDATAGSTLLPFSGAVGGGGSTNTVCYARAPTGHPAMEIKNNDGANSGGIDWDIRFWEASAGIRHVRVVMEIRVSHPNDPTTYQSEGLFDGLGAWPDWFDSIQGGGKLMIGLHCNSPGASCKYNWYAKPELPTTNATYRIGWGGPIGGTNPGFRSIMPLEIGWNRPFQCEVGPIESDEAEHCRISTLGDRWSRLELELKLCSPSGTPSDATEGNTGFGGSDGTASDPGPGDGFTKVFITRDVDGELGSPGSRINIGHVRGTVSFPRPDQHLAQSIREILFTMWYGGTGSSTYPKFESPVWVRRVEMYHYPEDDI